MKELRKDRILRFELVDRQLHTIFFIKVQQERKTDR
jgi:hypothetical protein